MKQDTLSGQLARTSVVALATALIGSWAPAGARAQADTTRLATVVVTATRTPLPQADVPATVSVITGDALRLQGVTTVADALRQLPGVTVAQTGSFGGNTSLFLRGGESKYVKVLIDGVPVNDPGGAFDFGALTVDNVDRIEVVRGPASVLYGADAVTGVVQIFTRAGGGRPRGELAARAGTYGSNDADGALLGGLAGVGYSMDLAHHASNGIYQFNNADRDNVASGLVRLAPDSVTELRIMIRYREYAYHYPTNGGGVPQDSNAFDAQDETTVGVQAARTLSARVNGQVALSSHETTGGTTDLPNGAITSSYTSLDHIRRRSVEAHLNVELAPPLTLTVGGQLEQEDEHSESQYQSGSYASNTVFSAARNNQALYAQLLSTLPHGVVVTAGGRYDQNQRFGAFDTYRLAAGWRVLAHTRLRASAGTAFREPTFAENYSTSFTMGNTALQPERTASWEAGVEQSVLDDRISFGATYFAQRFRNMIDYDYSNNACGASYCNVARALANGQELEAIGRLGLGLTADANLTHLDTRVLQPGFDTSSNGLYLPGQQLIRRPRTSWTVGLTSHLFSRGALDVHVLHEGERNDRDFSGYPAKDVVDPPFTRTDVGAELLVAGRAAGGDTARLTLRVQNALGVMYSDVFGFRSPGRVVLAGAKVGF